MRRVSAINIRRQRPFQMTLNRFVQVCNTATIDFVLFFSLRNFLLFRFFFLAQFEFSASNEMN